MYISRSALQLLSHAEYTMLQSGRRQSEIPQTRKTENSKHWLKKTKSSLIENCTSSDLWPYSLKDRRPPT